MNELTTQSSRKENIMCAGCGKGPVRDELNKSGSKFSTFLDWCNNCLLWNPK